MIFFQAFILALLPLVAFADHAPAYGYGPQYHCRDTNTSVYAEVCVPAFTNVEKEVVLDVKVVEDNDYCYEQITTVCSLTTRESSHTLCTYSYQDKTDTLPARITQVCAKFYSLMKCIIIIFEKFFKSFERLKTLQ